MYTFSATRLCAENPKSSLRMLYRLRWHNPIPTITSVHTATCTITSAFRRTLFRDPPTTTSPPKICASAGDDAYKPAPTP